MPVFHLLPLNKGVYDKLKKQSKKHITNNVVCLGQITTTSSWPCFCKQNKTPLLENGQFKSTGKESNSPAQVGPPRAGCQDHVQTAF